PSTPAHPLHTFPYTTLFRSPIKFPQLCQPCRHGEWISRKRSRLVNRSNGREAIHNFRAAAERPDRQTTANDLAERRQIRPSSIKLLRAASRNTETSHDFIED